jgi:hypothetical protein
MAQLAAADLNWDVPVSYRRGSPARLAGIDLYYDFPWLDHFNDARAQFKHGLCLARLVQRSCPSGLTPALLLTASDSVEERIIQTDSHFVLVVDLPRYRSQATGNAAESYYADRLGIQALATRPDVVNAVLTQLSIDDITTWVSEDVNRIDQVRGIAGVRDGSSVPATAADAIAALRALDTLDASDIAALAALFGPDTDRDARMELVRRITGDPTGRYVTGQVLVQRTTDRIADARSAMSDYQQLLNDPGSNETTMQHFIESNLWLLGLDYAHMRARHQLPRGTMDFILQRFDGFHDLLELKSPQDPVIRAPVAVSGDMPASPSGYSLSPDLAQALAQAHVYRDILSRSESISEDLYGLPHARDARLIIVIGKAEAMPSECTRVLREINKSLHHVEIVPYDVLSKRANAVLDNVELYLIAADESSEILIGDSDET